LSAYKPPPETADQFLTTKSVILKPVLARRIFDIDAPIYIAPPENELVQFVKFVWPTDPPYTFYISRQPPLPLEIISANTESLIVTF
jgi:hypothetical protein